MNDAKKREYDAIMAQRRGQPRSAVTGAADPFGDCSLTDMVNETEILERLGQSWKMDFCQVTTGFVRRAGGIWCAYSKDQKPKALLHVERFQGRFPVGELNFWADHIVTGIKSSMTYGIPFGIIVDFVDGLYSCMFGDPVPEYRILIGSRLQKTPEFDGILNLVAYFNAKDFKKIGRGREENPPQTDH